jgi:hypothetical protein
MELKEFTKEEFDFFLEKNYKSAIGKVRVAMSASCKYGTVFLLCTGPLRFDSAYLCRKLLREYDITHLYFNGKCYTRKWFEDRNWEVK